MTEPKNPKHRDFDYKLAFSRNIGWISELEQQQLRGKKIAIAGLGGVGGFHLTSLVRLGISNFHIADLDRFEIQNFNRQIGATLQSIDHQKIDVLEQMAKNINPDSKITCFKEGITESNLAEFLDGVDLYVDGLDYFCLRIRAKVFKLCRELNIPAITAAPIGMGTAYLIFMPETMSFEEYFRFEGLSDEEMRYNFLLGLTPKPMSFKYLVDSSSINFTEKRGPSTVMACELSAGIVATEALKILLQRGPIYPAPYYQLFDAYLGKFHRGKLWWGNKNPIQNIKRYVVKKMFARTSLKEKTIIHSIDSNHSDLEKILELARWTPSGDNHQPWRFEIKNASEIIIHAEDDYDTDCYDFSGLPTMLACGMLLENIRIAATLYQRNVTWNYLDVGNHKHQFNIKLSHDDKQPVDPLANFIFLRSVDRRRFRLSSLTQKEKNILNSSITNHFHVRWFESTRQKWEMTKLNILSTNIRLRIPELYDIHRKVIDFEHSYSENAIPINATGMGTLSKAAMKWAMKRSSRMNFLCKYLGATYSAALELDIIPGIFSGAHFAILPNKNLTNLPLSEQYLLTGQAMQKFWLTATKLGLVLQPTFTTLAFVYYTNNQIKFTKDLSLIEKATQLTKKFKETFFDDAVFFTGRIGRALTPQPSTSRSVRKPLADLMIKKTESQ